MVLMGKETRENCQIVAELQRERKNSEISLDYFDNSIECKIHANMSMVDGKLHTLLSGLGGAFCCICSYDKEQCNKIECINAGFKIDRSLQETLEICSENLHLKKNRKTGDYEKRKGVTQEPIT